MRATVVTAGHCTHAELTSGIQYGGRRHLEFTSGDSLAITWPVSSSSCLYYLPNFANITQPTTELIIAFYGNSIWRRLPSWILSDRKSDGTSVFRTPTKSTCGPEVARQIWC